MSSHKYAFVLLLVLATSFAFDPSDYFYLDEEDVTVAYTDFQLNGSSYRIVEFDGEQTFLLKDDEIMSDQYDIESAMYSYYIKNYYPSEDDLTELRELIKRFNDSRNDGYDWKDKEEYVCRDDILFANGKITMSGEPVRCVDEESCQQNAMLLYAAYGEGLGLGSVDPLYNAIYDFAPSSFAMDWILGNYTAKLDSLSEETVVDTIDYIYENANDLKEYSEDVESTVFRTPRLDDEDDRDACMFKCFGLCPSFDLDQDAAEDIEDLADELKDKIGPLSGYEGSSETLFENTQARLNYAETESSAKSFSNKFKSLNESAFSSIENGEFATEKVANISLSSRLTELKKLYADIPNAIEERDFSTMESDFESFEDLIDEVDEMSEPILDQYNKTSNAKNMLSSLILVLETKDLDPVSTSALGLLKNKSSDLNAEFHDGITIIKLTELEGQYQELLEDGQRLLRKESDLPATKVLLLFRGFARNVNEGIVSAAENSEALSRDEISENKFVALTVFSTLLFLSLASIVVLVFLYILATTKFVVPKTGAIVATAFISLMIVLLGFSVLTYLFLNKTSSDATLTEFLEDFDKRPATAIVVELQDTSYSDAQAMDGCAVSLSSTLEDQNKSWSKYLVKESTCLVSTSSGSTKTLTVDECRAEAFSNGDKSSFILDYSNDNEPPKFSVIYENKAEIKANMDYYESCPLVALFS